MDDPLSYRAGGSKGGFWEIIIAIFGGFVEF